MPAIVDSNATSTLLQRWHQGDSDALSRLVELHLPWLRAHVAARLSDRLRGVGEVDDYLQDVMLSFLRDAPRFQVRDEAHFRALLGKVAEHTLCDRHDWFRAKRRDIARNGALPSDSVLALDPTLRTGTTPSGAATRGEQRDWVRLGLELLPPEDRRILIAREFDGRSFVEIGADSGMTANAVRMRWVRAVAHLADILLELRRGRVPAPDGTAPPETRDPG